jgi:hypothetical protein
MNSLPIRKEDLDKYRNDAEIVHKTALQVIKDFAQFNFDISFPVDLNMAYVDLFEQLSPAIKDLLNTNITKLFSLLYCIDLNEKTIKNVTNDMADVPLHEVITHLVLERELKKVITRDYFSKNNSSLGK